MTDTTTTPENPVILLEDPENLLQEPGAYPQDDGTVLIVLATPLKRADSIEIKTVSVLRGLTAAEEDRAGGVAGLSMMINSTFAKVVGSVTEPQITGNRFMQMPARDRMSVMQGILHFFG